MVTTNFCPYIVIYIYPIHLLNLCYICIWLCNYLVAAIATGSLVSSGASRPLISWSLPGSWSCFAGEVDTGRWTHLDFVSQTQLKTGNGQSFKDWWRQTSLEDDLAQMHYECNLWTVTGRGLMWIIGIYNVLNWSDIFELFYWKFALSSQLVVSNRFYSAFWILTEFEFQQLNINKEAKLSNLQSGYWEDDTALNQNRRI